MAIEPLDLRADAQLAAEPTFWDDSCASPATNAALEWALGKLRPEEREALYLSAVRGFTAQEIAELRGCDPGG